MHNYSKFYIAIVAVLFVATCGFLYQKNRELSKNLEVTTGVSRGLKDEIEQLSAQIRENKAQIEENRIRSERESTQLNSFKKGRQELVDQMLQLQSRKSELEKNLADKESRLKSLEEALKPVPELKENLKKTEEKLQETQEELTALRRRDEPSVDDGSEEASDGTQDPEMAADPNFIETTRWRIRDKQARLEASGNSDSYVKKELVDLYYNLGVALAQKKDYAAAITELENALALNPADAEVHYNMAVIYDQQLKDMGSALEHYREYLKLNPGAQDAKKIRYLIFVKELETKLKS